MSVAWLHLGWRGLSLELSVQVIGLFVGSVVVGTIFVLYELHLERNDGQPILSPVIYGRDSIFSVSVIITIIFGLALFGSVYFIPLFVQGVIGTSATNSRCDFDAVDVDLDFDQHCLRTTGIAHRSL